MARVNIDDRLFSDPRWMNFVLYVGCQDKAVGMYYRAVRLVQNHWRTDFLVPVRSWRSLKVPLEKFDLAEITKDGVYLHGSDKRLSWYKTRMTASEAGVAKKREKRKNHMDNHDEPYGQPNGEPTRNHMVNPPVPVPVPVLNSANALVVKCAGADAIAPLADAKKIFDPDSEIPETETEISVDFSGEKSLPVSSTETSPESTEAPVPVSQGRSDLKSTSFDEQPVKNDLPDTNRIPAPAKKRKRADVSPEDAAARSATRSAYVEAFEVRYSSKPIIAAKENTQIKNLVSSVGQQDAPFLVKFYLECSDDFLVNKCHPIGILSANPTEYLVRWKRGQTHKNIYSYRQRQDSRRLPQCESPNKWEYNLITNDDFPDDETTTTEAANV